MLTLTPCVCVLSAIAFSKVFELYLKDDELHGEFERFQTNLEAIFWFERNLI